jgi:hypothetical protein
VDLFAFGREDNSGAPTSTGERADSGSFATACHRVNYRSEPLHPDHTVSNHRPPLKNRGSIDGNGFGEVHEKPIAG